MNRSIASSRTLRLIKCLGGLVGTEIGTTGLYLVLEGLLPAYIGQSKNVVGRINRPHHVIGELVENSTKGIKAATFSFPNAQTKTAREVLEQSVKIYLEEVLNLSLKNKVNPVGGRPKLLSEARKKIDDAIKQIKKGLC